MKLRMLIVFALSTGMIGFLQPHLGAGDKKDKKDEEKEVVVNSDLNNADLKDKVLTQSFCKTYVYKMTQGRTYQIDMISRDFDAFLRLEDPKGDQVAADDDSGGMLNARIIHRAAVTGDFTICAMSLGGGSTGKFTLLVKDTTRPVVKGAKDGKPVEITNNKGSGEVTSTLDAKSPLRNDKKHQVYLFQMEAGKTYQIDMTSNDFDSYLFLEDPNGKLLAEDDDGGGFPSAKIVIK